MTPPPNPNATLDSGAVEDLRTRFRGGILLPGDAGYEDSRTVWNAMIDRRPALVARCLGVADVIAGVNFARDHGITLDPDFVIQRDYESLRGKDDRAPLAGFSGPRRRHREQDLRLLAFK